MALHDDVAAPTPEAPSAPEETPTSRRYATPTGAPCPRCVALDGTIAGEPDCHGCGCCLLLAGLL